MRAIVCSILTLMFVCLQSSSNAARGVDRTIPAHRADAYGKLPISFQVNQGQAPGSAKYIARGRGFALALHQDAAVLSLAKSDSEPVHIRMSLAGASKDPIITAEDELPGKVNYLIGRDRARWRTGIPTYRQVRYRDVYPGIDLVYYGHQHELEYDFVLAAGVEPASIRMTFQGARSMTIDDSGDLVLDAGARVRMRKPFAYQERHGRRTEVPSRYLVLKDEQVGFHVDGYDPALPLVIDPILQYATFVGGSSPENAHAVAVDADGSAYIVGSTTSDDFPTVSAFQPEKPGGPAGLFNDEVFVSKLNADGTALVYSTYLGGTDSGFLTARDFGVAIAVTSSGSAIIAGKTTSTNFPVVNALQPTYAGGGDAFIAELNATGTDLVFSTYLGGSGPDDGRGMAVDPAGRISLLGWTASPDFPTVNAFQAALNGAEGDAFVATLNPDGSALVYSTYLGGDHVEFPDAIATDSLGNAYVTGSTESENFPTRDPMQPEFRGGGGDAFVSKFDPAGGLVYSTFLGGSGPDSASGIAVDGSGSAYVSGWTGSPDFPLSNPMKAALEAGGYDAFVSKLNAAGTGLSYSTYLGGSDVEISEAVAVDATGSAYVTGVTWSSDFPTVAAFQPTLGNVTGPMFYDAFVAKLRPDGAELVYSSYLGSTEKDAASGIAVDAAGSAYIVGTTWSSYFPTVSAMAPDMIGQVDGFIVKIADAAMPGVTGVFPSLGTPDTAVEVTITGHNFVPGATTVSADGASIAVDNVTVTSPTSLTATFLVSNTAALDARRIRVETPDGVSNHMMFTIASSAPQCPVSLPVKLNGTVGRLSVHFGIGTSGPVQGTWMLTLMTHDGTTTRYYGIPLYITELPTINPPITTWTDLPADIEGNPVVGVINGYFTPELCASNVAVAPEPASP